MSRVLIGCLFTIATSVAICLAGACHLAAEPTDRSAQDIDRWTRDAISSDSVVAQGAIKSLRALGPQGLAAFCYEHEKQLAELQEKPACLSKGSSPEQRLTFAVETIAGQRDAAWARLYWYTDFAAAKAAALRENKPIVTLRLLGKLTDELSCANSRYFRTTLYVDPKIAEYLRSKFILHWQSVRPAPKIIIDFGDGRRLERTIVGNSAHYVLDREGNVIDVLPGLYAPDSFFMVLNGAATAASAIAGRDNIARNKTLAEYHLGQHLRLKQEILESGKAASGNFVSVPVLVPKGLGEDPVLKALRLKRQNLQTVSTGATRRNSAIKSYPIAGTELLSDLDREFIDDVLSPARLSPESQRLIMAKLATVPDKDLPAPRAAIEQLVIANLCRAISADTTRSEYGFHRTIHGWLADGKEVDLEKLNDRIFAELFLTPNDDRWLGLLNIEAFSAIDAYGIIEE